METTTLNPDWIEFLESLNAHDVEFIVIGAWALAHHGRPRYTGDLDIFVRPSVENAHRLMAALRQFGVPTGHVTLDDLSCSGTTVTFGTPPRRIDVLNWLSGLEWDEAASDAVAGDLGGVPVRFLSIRALKVNKSAAGRGQDRDDLRGLT